MIIVRIKYWFMWQQPRDGKNTWALSIQCISTLILKVSIVMWITGNFRLDFLKSNTDFPLEWKFISIVSHETEIQNNFPLWLVSLFTAGTLLLLWKINELQKFLLAELIVHMPIMRRKNLSVVKFSESDHREPGFRVWPTCTTANLSPDKQPWTTSLACFWQKTPLGPHSLTFPWGLGKRGSAWAKKK